MAAMEEKVGNDLNNKILGTLNAALVPMTETVCEKMVKLEYRVNSLTSASSLANIGETTEDDPCEGTWTFSAMAKWTDVIFYTLLLLCATLSLCTIVTDPDWHICASACVLAFVCVFRARVCVLGCVVCARAHAWLCWSARACKLHRKSLLRLLGHFVARFYSVY